MIVFTICAAHSLVNMYTEEIMPPLKIIILHYDMPS